ncbi:hypothetical protein BZG36_02277 [Bifiguratus adelaidae]|uniref:Transcription initiation factor TFIID subunit 13 n=1 Tax=Bifiguratus adelaidae TaxID=1938954 RepID=A0A261XY44_9FUNG|nr:hypothetical protein BZG36_02277 [Bifiguratus adelaidae]
MDTRDDREGGIEDGREGTTGPGRRRIVRKGMFVKDLKLLMYGFGDGEVPVADTLAVMDDIVVDYITEMCLQAANVAEKRNKVKVEDFQFLLRRDPKKLARVEELLYMNQVLSKARQVIMDPDKLDPDAEDVLSTMT